MEMQRHAQLMYTSCGWFFDDISGIETVQVIAYAARALQLAQRAVRRTRPRALNRHFSPAWPRRKSNVASAGDGARIYREKIGPLQLGLEQVAAHYAISSVFSSFAEETELFCYRVRRISYEMFTSGRGRLALGRAHITSAITGQSADIQLCRAALRRSEHYGRRETVYRRRRGGVRRICRSRPRSRCSAPTSPM